MARGAEGKLRRRNRRKEEQATADQIFGDMEQEDNDIQDTGIPLPPGMAANASSGDDDAESDEGEEKPIVPKKKKKKKTRAVQDEDGEPMTMPQPMKKGIKSTPLIFLILMTGTTLLPVLIYASDIIGNMLQQHHVMGQLGFRLGMGAVPRQRVLSFYEKHDPNKIEAVPDILSKYYGDYPKLVKKLERKYQDYGYFVGWEEDESTTKMVMEQLEDAYRVWLTQYWNVYAPQPIKTAVRNIRYNMLFLKKKFMKAWKKQIWPALEPFFGVPKGAEQQKRADAAEARKRRPGNKGSGTRRRNSEFRDDVEEE